MIKQKTWLSSHIHYYILFFMVIQPVLDVVSYWIQYAGMSTAPTLALRMALLGITVVIAFLVTDNKKAYGIAFGISLFLLAGHMIAAYLEGYLNPFTDLTNFMRVVQMPLITMCLITFCKINKNGFHSLQMGFSLVLLIMLSVEIISVITGTNPHTYSTGLGILGWFHNTNSQSANLCMLIPLSLAWQLSWKERRPLLFWSTVALGLMALYFFCTRLAYLGIGVICVGFCISIFLIRRKDWKIAVAFVLIGLLFLGLMPVSPMMRNMNAHNSAQDQRQGWLEDKLGEDVEDVKDLINKNNTPPANPDKPDQPDQPHKITKEEHERLVKDLTPIYETYVPDFVRIFGAEKTMEMYNYTIDVRELGSIRPKKLMFAKMLMLESGPMSHLFGLELARFTVGDSIYDVENDFHGIYYLYGAVGFALYLAFILYFVGLVIWALFKNAKKYFTYEAAGYGIAFLLCMAHAYNTAGVLRRPNASVFLSAILAGIYYLVRIHTYPDPQREIKNKK